MASKFLKKNTEKNQKSYKIALGIGQNCFVGALIEGFVSFQSVDLIVSGFFFLIFFNSWGNLKRL